MVFVFLILKCTFPPCFHHCLAVCNMLLHPKGNAPWSCLPASKNRRTAARNQVARLDIASVHAKPKMATVELLQKYKWEWSPVQTRWSYHVTSLHQLCTLSFESSLGSLFFKDLSVYRVIFLLEVFSSI